MSLQAATLLNYLKFAVSKEKIVKLQKSQESRKVTSSTTMNTNENPILISVSPFMSGLVFSSPLWCERNNH